jgi:hypothetical protein
LGKSSTTFVPKVVLDKHLRRAAAESKTPLRAKGAGFIARGLIKKSKCKMSQKSPSDSEVRFLRSRDVCDMIPVSFR